jgi:hypothetical protein
VLTFKNFKSRDGFTFIELTLVIGLVFIVGISTAAFYTHFINQMAIRDAHDGLVGMLQEAQVYSLSGRENSSWGVKRESSDFLLFCGDSSLGRDPAFDLALAFNPNLAISGFDEVVFSRSSGYPDQAHSSIIISWGNDQESFSLNSEGAIE